MLELEEALSVVGLGELAVLQCGEAKIFKFVYSRKRGSTFTRLCPGW